MTALDLPRLAALLNAVDCRRCPFRSPAHGDCSSLAALTSQAPCETARQEVALLMIDAKVA